MMEEGTLQTMEMCGVAMPSQVHGLEKDVNRGSASLSIKMWDTFLQQSERRPILAYLELPRQESLQFRMS